MAWVTAKPNAIDIKKEPKKEYVGFYQGSIKIETKLGEQTIWNFRNDEGKQYGIYGFTNLNSAMAVIAKDAYVRIIYQGTKTMDTKYKKNQDVHQVTVEYEDNSETT